MVSMAAMVSPSPMRLVQRVRLWAIPLSASQAALAPKRPAGRWLSPTPHLEWVMDCNTSRIGYLVM